MPSTTIQITSALFIASNDLDTEYFSKSTLICFFLRMPAVSINVYSLLLIVSLLSIASLVVPAISLTINLSSFNNLLTIELLPAFGLPTNAIFNPRSENSSSVFLILNITSSSSSPIPLP